MCNVSISVSEMSNIYEPLGDESSLQDRIDAELDRINEGIDTLMRMRGLTDDAKIAKLHMFADLIQSYVIFHHRHGWTKADQPGRLEEYLPYTHAIGQLYNKHL